jgi:uncharacterized membrane protein YfcA
MFLAAGILGGILLGLIGVGMALVSVPFLTLALPHLGVGVDDAPLTALATSMAVVTVGSISSIFSHHRLGNVDWHLVGIIIPAGLVGVSVGSVFASHLPGIALKWIFSLFLLYIALKMLFSRAAGHSHVAPTSAWTYRGLGGLIGVAGSLIGAGGGVFMVPFLSNRGHKMAKAVATSTAIGFPVSLLGSVVYAFQQTPAAQVPMVGYILVPAFIGISLGSIFAAPIGAKLASKIPGAMLKKGFAALLLILAVRLIVA